ncbi:hypothetical protein EVAR_67093_1 [Eumeta japonica]|uniref:Uncharacterized protein n=1 Tax=Eumeta variegata TaxID=151549 RepID=A0A4C1ZV93_EUMVA|nr:hypothetical protein EVAR_67093_1 [Eumeta japonica]
MGRQGSGNKFGQSARVEIVQPTIFKLHNYSAITRDPQMDLGGKSLGQSSMIRRVRLEFTMRQSWANVMGQPKELGKTLYACKTRFVLKVGDRRRSAS